MINYAANAVLAKSKAKYGRRVRQQAYHDMMTLGSVAEVVSYLASNTHYGELLLVSEEKDLHRDAIEAILKDKIYADFLQLCRFERSVRERLYVYFELEFEIEQIIRFFSYYLSGQLSNFRTRVPFFPRKKGGIDFDAIKKISQFDDLLAVFADTDYQQIIESFRPHDDSQIDISVIEAALKKHLYKRAFALIDDSFSSETKKELVELLGLKIETENIARIYRARKYYGVTNSVLRSEIVPYRRHLSSFQLEKLLDAPTADEVEKLIKNTSYGRFFGEISHFSIDNLLQKIYARRVYHKMLASSNPPVVLFCCIAFYQFEVKNIINIVEGVRYRLAYDEMSRLLIADEK